MRLLLAAPLAPEEPGRRARRETRDGALALAWPDQTLEFDAAGRLARAAPSIRASATVLHARWSDWRDTPARRLPASPRARAARGRGALDARVPPGRARPGARTRRSFGWGSAPVKLPRRGEGAVRRFRAARGVSTKRWLIVVPLVVVALLLQSAFWVPRYETQSAGNPKRLTTYIEASIGDAADPEPDPLGRQRGHAESRSSCSTRCSTWTSSCDARGKLAERWETTEEAYLAVLPGRALPDGAPATAARVAERVRAALARGRARRATCARSSRCRPRSARPSSRSIETDDERAAERAARCRVRVDVPERVKITLARVVPDLFERLAPVLGPALLDPRGPRGARASRGSARRRGARGAAPRAARRSPSTTRSSPSICAAACASTTATPSTPAT